MEPVLYFNQIVCRLKLALEWSLPDQGHKGPLLNPGVHLHLAPEVELTHLLQLLEATTVPSQVFSMISSITLKLMVIIFLSEDGIDDGVGVCLPPPLPSRQ